MTKKAWFLLVLAALLGGAYAYYFTDWVNTPQIQIIKSDRPIRSGRSAQTVYPITFTLDGHYDLTAVKVVRVSDLSTNQNPLPLWELVATNKPAPSKGFFYGQRIPGLGAPGKNQRALPLEAGKTYRLLVKAGRARGQIDFQATPVE